MVARKWLALDCVGAMMVVVGYCMVIIREDDGRGWWWVAHVRDGGGEKTWLCPKFIGKTL